MDNVLTTYPCYQIFDFGALAFTYRSVLIRVRGYDERIKVSHKGVGDNCFSFQQRRDHGAEKGGQHRNRLSQRVE